MEQLSVVIPAWNEELRIGDTVRKISDYLVGKEFLFEIIVADDGSTDQTREIAERAGKSVRVLILPHRGKGNAVREGMLAASGDLILVTDADLSTPIEEIERFLQIDASVVIASRALPTSIIPVHQPRYREIGGKLLNIAVRLVVLPGIKDTQCGFKLFQAKAAKEIFRRQTIPGFGFDIEILFIARRFGYQVIELPVRWTNDDRTKVHPFQSGITILVDLFRIRLNSLRGKYQ
ncbi:MAG: dolichyl-phosphate beta-glucosyltransferase [Patescibacteria group bacterium]